MATASTSRVVPNVGRTDRLARIVAGLVLLILAVFVIDGGWALLAGLASLVLIVTGFVSFCPVYRLLGISSTS